jgi:hypothetical protein
VNLGRRSSTATAPADDAVDVAAEPVGKGRPTPKRADSRKARRNAAPQNRKEAATLVREKNRQERRLTRQALLTGDERHLPARDAGPEKRLARDLVDSHFTYGQIFFVLIILAFALSFIQSNVFRTIANFAALLGLSLIVVDGVRNGRRAKLAVIAKYGPAEARGVSSYAFMRALMPRRFRKPPPKVKRGDTVR